MRRQGYIIGSLALIATLLVGMLLLLCYKINEATESDIVILRAPTSPLRTKLKVKNVKNTDIRIFDMIEDENTEVIQ